MPQELGLIRSSSLIIHACGGFAVRSSLDAHTATRLQLSILAKAPSFCHRSVGQRPEPRASAENWPWAQSGQRD